MKYSIESIVEVLAVVLSALAAWWSKRNNQQLKPNQLKAGRAAHSHQNHLEGDAINIGDLVTGLLEETNRIHDRLDRMEERSSTRSRA